MNLKIVITALLFLFLSSIVLADKPLTISWNPPTECTNGDKIGETELCGRLTRFGFQCSDKQGGPYTQQWGTSAYQDGVLVTQYTAIYEERDYYCILKARNAAGFSDASNEIFFNVATPPATDSLPNPPTNITITVQATE